MNNPKSINKRVRIRRACNLVVYVQSAFKDKGERVKYDVRDLSNKGAFIKCNPALLYKDMQVSLVFVIPLGNIYKLHRINAIVARVVNDGVGVRFLTQPRQSLDANQVV